MHNHSIRSVGVAALALLALAAAVRPADAAGPSLVAGSIVGPTTFNVARVPNAPAINIQATDAVGIDYVYISALSPSGGQYLRWYYRPPVQPTTLSLTLQDPLPSIGNQGNGGGLSLYSEPGTWSVNYVYLTGPGGGSSYSGSALTAKFPNNTFTVVNTVAPDTTPPAISLATLLKKTVSLAKASPVQLARYYVNDSGSGVYYNAIYLKGPDGSSYAFGTKLPAPITFGPTLNNVYLSNGLPLGQWSVYGIQSTDTAGNTFSEFDPARISTLFGGKTTFTLTN